jgi:hypothetical protein
MRFAAAATLINDLVEAQHQPQLGHVLARGHGTIRSRLMNWALYRGRNWALSSCCGYRGAGREGSVIVTTTLPFSERTQVWPRCLCKATA